MILRFFNGVIMSEHSYGDYVEQEPFFRIRFSNDNAIMSPTHSHDSYEVLFLKSGECDYIVNDCFYHLRPHDIVLIPPRSLHHTSFLATNEDHERIALWVSESLMASYQSQDPCLVAAFQVCSKYNNHLIRPRQNTWQELYNILQQILEEQSHNLAGSNYCSKILVSLFFLYLYRSMTTSSSDVQLHQCNSQIQNVVSYITQNYMHHLTLEQLANINYTSKYHLAHEFKKETGISIYQYITLKRLATAKSFLLKGVSPNKIPQLCGFTDYVCFYRAFKKEYMMSPSQYIKNMTINREKKF